MRCPTLVQVAVGFILMTCTFSLVMAEVRLPAVLGDNMVLQHGQPVPIWGWAGPGEIVSASIADNSISVETDNDGCWRMTLPKLKITANPLTMNIEGSSGSRIVVKGILVGEVWFCTGPSNIFWPVKRCDNAKDEISAADYPGIRFFTVKRNATNTPQADCMGHWFECSPKTVGNVSGVGYFFSRRLHHDLKMPIGIIQSFWGGSRIEAWTSIEALEAEPKVKPILDWWADKESVLKNPRASWHRPASIYNGMVAPLIPYGIRGVISYQGLGNLFWAPYSRPLLATMVRDWRSRWGQGNFPFGMVQPAPYRCNIHSNLPKSSSDAYALLREAQLLLLNTIPNVGIAPTMDLGDVDVLHFPNKQPVAQRLAHWALATVYGRDVPCHSPIYKSMTVEDNAIRIHFAHADAGLTTSDGLAPTHFTIAGPNNVFHPAMAKIENNTVIVHSDRVLKPVAVRFAFSDTAVPNLINHDGLPASLFRTDVPKVDNTSEK